MTFLLPTIDNKIVFLRDVGFAHDGFAPQTNIVRRDGIESVLMQVLKNGAASTLDIVNQVKNFCPRSERQHPKE